MAGSKFMAPGELLARGKAARDLVTGRKTRTGGPGPDPIGIYLNDHLAGATLGEGRAWSAASAVKDTSAASDLRRIAAEITQDRAALLQIMADLGIGVRHYKVYAAWAAEKAGRLKPNGHLISRSPLSDLVEVEFLLMGVEGKSAAWHTLRTLADYDTRLDSGQLDDLIARAKRQAGTLEILRGRAVAALVAARTTTPAAAGTAPAATDPPQPSVQR